MNLNLNELSQFLLIFVRGNVLFMGFPAFSGQALPLRIRIGFAACMAYLLVGQYPVTPIFSHVLVAVLAVLNEVLIGFLMMLGAKMIFYAVEFAGQIMSSEIGLAMSSSLNPDFSGASTTMSQLLFYTTLLLFWIAHIPELVIQVFAQSFIFAPSGGFFLSYFSISHLIQAVSGLFILGLQLAMPVLAVNFLVNLVFAILGKAVPRMNVFATSFSVRILAGFFIFFSTLSLFVNSIVEEGLNLPNHIWKLFSF